MRHLKLFESFVQALNEISFSDHWMNRTATGGSLEYKLSSRIIPYDMDSTDSGYVINGFISGNGELKGVEALRKEKNLTEKTMYDLITYALKAMTTSRTLRDWTSSSGKDFVMLNLGRICFYFGDSEKYYAVLKGGVSKKAKKKAIDAGKKPLDFYDPGDTIYGYVKEKDRGMTIKYYPSTPQGEKESYYKFKGDSKLSDADFFSNYVLEFPYGKRFEVLIDFTDIRNTTEGPALNIPMIRSKIDQQIRGEGIELGPSPSPKMQIKLPAGEQQLNLSPGTTIMLPAKDQMQEYEILTSSSEPGRADIINRESFKNEKKIELKMLRPDKGFIVKKELTPGMRIMIKKGGAYREAKITDRLYIQDERLGEPVNLAYRFL